MEMIYENSRTIQHGLQMSTRLNKFQAVGIIVVKLDYGER